MLRPLPAPRAAPPLPGSRNQRDQRVALRVELDGNGLHPIQAQQPCRIVDQARGSLTITLVSATRMITERHGRPFLSKTLIYRPPDALHLKHGQARWAVRHDGARYEWIHRQEDRCRWCSPGQVSAGPSPALTCVAGNGGVRSSELKPKGSRSIREPQAKGKAGRVNASEPPMTPRYEATLRRWISSGGGRGTGRSRAAGGGRNRLFRL
jgi:hypothetical protein